MEIALLLALLVIGALITLIINVALFIAADNSTKKQAAKRLIFISLLIGMVGYGACGLIFGNVRFN